MKRKRTWPWLLTLLLVGCAGLPVHAASRANTVRERVELQATPPPGVVVRADGVWLMPCTATRKTMPCPRGIVCIYMIQDGPDGWPNTILRPECFVEREEGLANEAIIEPGGNCTISVEGERICELPLLEQVIDLACYDSLDDCLKFRDRECATRWPLRPGATAVYLNQIMDFSVGKQCNVVCYDKNGDPHGLGCTPGPPPKPKPRPQDQTLTSGGGTQLK